MANILLSPLLVIKRKDVIKIFYEKRTEEFRKTFFKNNNIFERWSFNSKRFMQFNSDPAIKGLPYIFITAPSINLSDDNIKYDKFFSYTMKTDPKLVKMLDSNQSAPLIPLLTNRMNEFSVNDYSLNTEKVGETYYGYSQTVPQYSPAAGGTTSVTYTDNSSLDILKLHKLWFDYITNVTRGTMRPSNKAVQDKYIDYTCSIYRFILNMDGETIQYFDKMTGCFPTNVPFSEFSSKVGGNQELVTYSIEYAYSWIEYMNPSIIYDFNEVTGGISSNRSESEYIAANDRYSNSVPDIYLKDDHSNLKRPYVATADDGRAFKLKFS